MTDEENNQVFKSIVVEVLKTTSAFDIASAIEEGKRLSALYPGDAYVADPVQAVQIAIYTIFKELIEDKSEYTKH